MNKPKSPLPRYSHINLETVLNERGMIAICLGIDFVQNIRPELSNEQAWSILQAWKRKHLSDPEFGWFDIEDFAYEMVPLSEAEANA